jgi:hypothetical protein
MPQMAAYECTFWDVPNHAPVGRSLNEKAPCTAQPHVHEQLGYGQMESFYNFSITLNFFFYCKAETQTNNNDWTLITEKDKWPGGQVKVSD